MCHERPRLCADRFRPGLNTALRRALVATGSAIGGVACDHEAAVGGPEEAMEPSGVTRANAAEARCERE
jgi:hypothetical protein